VAALGAVAYVARGLAPEAEAPAADPRGPRVRVVIPPGSDGGAIGDILERRRIVADGGNFADYANDRGEGADFKAGTYRIRRGTGYDRIIAVLNAGPPAPVIREVTIPEGLRLTEVVDLVAENGVDRAAYQAALRRARPPEGFGAQSLEGFLFPATYTLAKKRTAAQLVADQLRAFDDRFDGIDMTYAESRNLNRYDVVKIASMIEREAQVARERALVSAVIYNRLRLGMTLGIDATIRYQVGSWTAPLTVSQLERDTPYNTRTRQGLPPTPIANPGEASLRAAARPADVDYLYYVAQGDSGRHFFTADFDEFCQNGGAC
jgi:UPF0755 protein